MLMQANKLSVLWLSCAMALIGVGCHTSPDVTPKSNGEKIEYRASVLKQKGELTQKGERAIADGNAMMAKGKALSEQGQTMEGQKMVIDGEAKVREGQMYIDQANNIVLPDAPATVNPGTQPTHTDMSTDKPM